jgi:hypothetical protein
MKKEIEKTKQVEKVINVQTFKESNQNSVPSGFTRNYSNAVNPLNSITNQITNQFNLLSQELKSSLNSTISQQLQISMDDIKINMENLVSKLIVENNNKMCHFIIDILRTLIPSIGKPDEKTINIISSRHNHHKMGNISTKNLTEYINKLWK